MSFVARYTKTLLLIVNGLTWKREIQDWACNSFLQSLLFHRTHQCCAWPYLPSFVHISQCIRTLRNNCTHPSNRWASSASDYLQTRTTREISLMWALVSHGSDTVLTWDIIFYPVNQLTFLMPLWPSVESVVRASPSSEHPDSTGCTNASHCWSVSVQSRSDAMVSQRWYNNAERVKMSQVWCLELRTPRLNRKCTEHEDSFYCLVDLFRWL